MDKVGRPVCSIVPAGATRSNGMEGWETYDGPAEPKTDRQAGRHAEDTQNTSLACTTLRRMVPFSHRPVLRTRCFCPIISTAFSFV